MDLQISNVWFSRFLSMTFWLDLYIFKALHNILLLILKQVSSIITDLKKISWKYEKYGGWL